MAVKIYQPKNFLERVKDLIGLKPTHIKVGILSDQGGVVSKRKGSFSSRFRYVGAKKGVAQRVKYRKRLQPRQNAPTMVQVACWAEFGTKTQPARPFVRGFVDQNQAKIKAQLRRAALASVRDPKNKRMYMSKFGAYVAGGMKKGISERIPPPNSTWTIQKKGSDVPLIDTGQLRSAISFELTRG